MITTGFGSWSPLVFLVFSIVVVLFVYIIRSLGESGYRKEKEKEVVFFSGNLPPADRITGIYWGFFEALRRYYKWMEKIHNGIVNDYVYWFVLTVTVIIGLVMLL